MKIVGRIVKQTAAMQVGVSIRTWKRLSSSSRRSSPMELGFLPIFRSMSALRDDSMLRFHTMK